MLLNKINRNSWCDQQITKLLNTHIFSVNKRHFKNLNEFVFSFNYWTRYQQTDVNFKFTLQSVLIIWFSFFFKYIFSCNFGTLWKKLFWPQHNNSINWLFRFKIVIFPLNKFQHGYTRDPSTVPCPSIYILETVMFPNKLQRHVWHDI